AQTSPLSLHDALPISEAVPPYAPDWAEAGLRETMAEAGERHFVRVPIGQAGAGDVLLFRWRAHLPAKHAAIMTDAASMVHAHDRSEEHTSELQSRENL